MLLVPEFCKMSGLPDDFDEFKRREVSKHTIINPDVKKARIDELARSFEKDLKDFGPESIKKSLKLSIETKSEKIEAVNLGPPHLALGRNNAIPA